MLSSVYFVFLKTTKTNWPNFLGFQNDIKLVINLQINVNNGTHLNAVTTGSGFKERFEKPSSTLTYGYENESIAKVKHNRKTIKLVIKTIELYGK